MKLKFALLLVIGVTFNSCSDRIVGTWTIQKYETTTPEKQDVSLKNIGTMTFYKNGKGEKNISYTIFESMKEDKSSFKWKRTEKFITIDGRESDFSKTWIIMTDDGKFQKWQSTDGNNQVQILELIR